MAGILDFFGGPRSGGGVLPGVPPELVPQQDNPFYTAAQNFAGNIRGGGGLLSSFLNAQQGFQTGQRTDPLGMAQQMQAATYQALRPYFPDANSAFLASTNPEAQKAVMAKLFPTYEFKTLGDVAGGAFSPGLGTFNPQVVNPQMKPLAPGEGLATQQPIFPGLAGGTGVPRPAPVVGSALAPPSGATAAPPLGGGLAQGPGQTVVPGMSLQEKEAQITAGKAQGTAAAEIPKAQQAAETALKLIEQIRNHPGRTGFTTGLMGTFTPAPGSKGYDFAQLVDQAKSGAFLTAYQTLRGGGAISNVEGDKAAQAITRMNRAQSREGFNQALNDYRDVIQQGYQNLQRIARGDMQPYPLNVPSAAQAPTQSVAPPPAGAINALRSNPSLRDQFDAKYGAGSAARVLSGG